MTKGFADAFSYGYRSLLRLTYDGLPGGITVNPTFIWFQDLHGPSPAPLVNFVDGRKLLISCVTLEFESDWNVVVNSQVLAGAGTPTRLRYSEISSARTGNTSG